MNGRRRVLFCSPFFYLDSSNGAATASRALMSCLARRGFGTEVVCGTMVDAGAGHDPASVLTARGLAFEALGDEASVIAGAGATRALDPPRLRTALQGVPVTVHRRSLRTSASPPAEAEEFLALFEAAFHQFRPDVLVTYGGDAATLEMLARARRRGVATVFTLHNFGYPHPAWFTDVDVVLVASEFSAAYHRAALGIECTVIPNLVDWTGVRAEAMEPRYVTFVNPSVEKGVYVFARIADELGRRRPDIPLLVVESRGTEASLVSCGLDLRGPGNVSLMSHTPDARDFWRVARLALLPSLWWENQPLVAIEAMINGVPVVGSDRGGIPEALGTAGVVLSLPDRLTAATRILPTAAEVAPWVEAIIRLWDDPAACAEHRRRGLAEAARWRPERVEPLYEQFFASVRPRSAGTPASVHEARAHWAVLVPFAQAIEWDCECALRALEAEGVRVVRARGASAIDVARNALVSEALRQGCESMLFVDSDIAFEPRDALRLLARPEPVVAGVYLKKASQEFACRFAPEVREALFGPNAPGLYPLAHASAGFLRIRAGVLRRMIDELSLPLCNTELRGGFWPFFQPMVVPDEGKPGTARYLAEDWAFSHRLRQVGITPMADTSIRLLHLGTRGYTWEDAMAAPARHPHITFTFPPPEPGSSA